MNAEVQSENKQKPESKKGFLHYAGAPFRGISWAYNGMLDVTQHPFTWFVAAMVVTFGVWNNIPYLKNVTLSHWGKNIFTDMYASMGVTNPQQLWEANPNEVSILAGVVLVAALLMIYVLFKTVKSVAFDNVPVIGMSVVGFVVALILVAGYLGVLPLTSETGLQLILFFLAVLVLGLVATAITSQSKTNLKFRGFWVLSLCAVGLNMLLFYPGLPQWLGAEATWSNLVRALQVSIAMILAISFLAARMRRHTSKQGTTSIGSMDDSIEGDDVGH